MTYRWLTKNMIIAIHGELIHEFGGLDGTFKSDSLESTLARPRQLLAYADPAPSLFELAANYGFGFAKNHCFSDGNKRVALASIDVFLQLNGFELTASELSTVDTIRHLAAGGIDEKTLAAWIDAHKKPLSRESIKNPRR